MNVEMGVRIHQHLHLDQGNVNHSPIHKQQASVNLGLYKIVQIISSTLANLTLITSYSEMLKFSNFISSKSKNIVKENSEYFKMFHLLK
jgi:hypothetical protein